MPDPAGSRAQNGKGRGAAVTRHGGLASGELEAESWRLCSFSNAVKELCGMFLCRNALGFWDTPLALAAQEIDVYINQSLGGNIRGGFQEQSGEISEPSFQCVGEALNEDKPCLPLE